MQAATNLIVPPPTHRYRCMPLLQLQESAREPAVGGVLGDFGVHDYLLGLAARITGVGRRNGDLPFELAWRA